MPDARAPRNGSRAWTPSAARRIHLRDLHRSSNKKMTGGSAGLEYPHRPWNGNRCGMPAYR